jgi:hypothetical protein
LQEKASNVKDYAESTYTTAKEYTENQLSKVNESLNLSNNIKAAKSTVEDNVNYV